MPSKSLFAAGLILLGGAAQAEVSRIGPSIGGSVGTQGYGGEIGYRVSNRFGLRARAQRFKLSGNAMADGVGYDYKVKLFTAGVIADYYPAGQSWRLSAGTYYNGNHVTIGNTASSVAIGGRSIAMKADTVTGRGRYRRIAPYVGIGYDDRLGHSSFELGFDLGIMYQGRARMSTKSSVPFVRDDDLAEVRQDVTRAMNKLRVYPVLGLKLGYRF